jgi:Spy/CpxP family protein refolding chaperone
MIKYLFTPLLLLVVTIASAQNFPDTAGMSPIKTMSYTQYKAYIDGIDQTNMAAVASLNHYAEPEKTLTWKKELGLTPAQVTNITTVNVALEHKMKEMGDFIVKNERALDELFRTKKVTDGNLIFYTNRFGLYQGEMRNAILQAAVKVQAILTPDQRKKYQQLQKVNR